MGGIPHRNLHNPEQVLDTAEDKDDAVRLWHEWAARLKRNRFGDTSRFGIDLRHEQGVWQIVFVDRAAKRGRKPASGSEGE